MAERNRVVILGAAGRDFHDFNVMYRGDPGHEVVAFTAAQIPGIEGRRYPPALAGAHYPDGIPIEDEADLERLIREREVDEVLFAYSDVPHAHVMHLASRALAAGASFRLAGPNETYLASAKPVIAVCAVRTGCGKSQTTRFLARRLRDRGLGVAVVRHPMPYGDLAAQAVQRFASAEDMDAADCTIEEREEYEPHIEAGGVVYAGVDYEAILRRAEEEADVILWDGGNNDFAFYRPDLQITLVDALRPGQCTTHHPGETTLRLADIIVVAKSDAAPEGQAEAVAREAAAVNPDAKLVHAASPVRLEDEEAIKGKRVVVVEDGPTITHGGMAHGAGYVAARQLPGVEIVDPRAAAVPSIAAVYEEYPHIGPVLPAMGYGAEQIEALRETLQAVEADAVVAGTPIDLDALLHIGKPVVRARYDYADAGEPGLGDLVDAWLAERGL